MKRPKGAYLRNFAGLKGKRILLSRTKNSQIRSLVTHHTFETKVTVNLFCSERMVVVIVEDGSLQETERASQFNKKIIKPHYGRITEPVCLPLCMASSEPGISRNYSPS